MYDVTLRESHFPAQHDGDVRETTVGSVLREAAADAPEATALVDGTSGRRWTYAELLHDAERVADALLTRYVPGERIAIWAPNAPEWVIVEFAAAIAGLTLVTVNPAYQARELEFVLRQSGSVGLLLVREFRGNRLAAHAESVRAALPALREVVDIENAAALHARAAMTHSLPDVQPGDPAQVQYTSGTTGFPKGAKLSHRNLTNNARFTGARFGTARGESVLNFMPMFHTAGCSLGVLGAVQARACLVVMRQFDPALALELVERERVVRFIAVPSMLVALLEAQARAPRDTRSLRCVLAGGAVVPADIVERVARELGAVVTIVYGQTETSPTITQTRADDALCDRLETIGQPMPHTDVAIRAPDSGHVVPLGTPGEMCVRGPQVMLGYHEDAPATARTIDSDGWLRTGDLGVMDARGYVRITGRIKDLIIRGGENIYPAEVENVLAAHASVAEVSVVGVPDARWGEIPIAFLRARSGATLDADALVHHVRAELAAPKTPAHWVVIDAFPMTASGKIQKFVLRDRWIAGEFAERVVERRAKAAEPG